MDGVSCRTLASLLAGGSKVFLLRKNPGKRGNRDLNPVPSRFLTRPISIFARVQDGAGDRLRVLIASLE